MQAALAAASKKKGRFGGLGDLSKILGFIPGVGAGVSAGLSGLESFGAAKAQKKALKGILNDPKFAGYSSTFLADPTKDYLKDVTKLRGNINPLKSALKAGGAAYGMSQITGNISEQIGGAFNPDSIAEGQMGDIFKGQGVGETKVTDILKGITERSGKGPLENLFKQFSFKDALGSFDSDAFGENMGGMSMLLDYLSGGASGGDVEFDPSSYFQ